MKKYYIETDLLRHFHSTTHSSGSNNATQAVKRVPKRKFSFAATRDIHYQAPREPRNFALNFQIFFHLFSFKSILLFNNTDTPQLIFNISLAQMIQSKFQSISQHFNINDTTMLIEINFLSSNILIKNVSHLCSWHYPPSTQFWNMYINSRHNTTHSFHQHTVFTPILGPIIALIWNTPHIYIYL